MAALTAKQSKFVSEYLVDGNGTRAAVAAGYGRAGARVTACRTLANPNVRAVVGARQSQDARRLEISRQDAIKGLLEAVDLAREQANPAAMISGWKTIGQMLGFMEPKRLQVEVAAMPDNDLMRALHTMSDAELSALIAPEATALAATA